MNEQAPGVRRFFCHFIGRCRVCRRCPAMEMRPQSKEYLDEALEDAHRLLKYAAEIGTDIDAKIRNDILRARTASENGWNEGTKETAADLLTALTRLAEKVKPVTAESLKAIEQVDLRGWFFLVFILALLICPFSVATFVVSGLTSDIRSDIVTGNDLAVNLTVQLGPLPPASQSVASIVTGASSPAASSTSTASLPKVQSDINKTNQITELQKFASIIRAIDARARQLNLLVLLPNRVPDPFTDIRGGEDKDKMQMHTIFELPPDGLPEFAQAAQAASDRIVVYQEVRYFAQNILDEVSLFYGAITVCILPVLYALLGTCAYLFRSFKRSNCIFVKKRTYLLMPISPV